MIEKIMNYLFLDKETKNLSKINKIRHRFNDIVDQYNKNKNLTGEQKLEMIKLYVDIKDIKTKEHKKKINLFYTYLWIFISSTIKDDNGI